MPEHTIAENLARLQAAKTAIGAAITAKGGTVSSGDGLEEYPTAIEGIPSGEGGNAVIEDGEGYTDFSGLNMVRRVTIPYGVTMVSLYSEWSYGNDPAPFPVLESIELPDTVEHIGNMSISVQGGPALSIYLPDSVTIISYAAFYYADFSAIRLPEPANLYDCRIEDYAFQGCAIEEITVPDNMDFYTEGGTGGHFMTCGNLTTATLGNNIEAGGTRFFDDCQVLESITIGNYCAFGGPIAIDCDSLQTINIGDHYGHTIVEGEETDWMCNIASNCASLETVTIGNDAHIGEEYYGFALDNCPELNTLTIGDNAIIGPHIINDCDSLLEITIGSDATIDSNAFGNSVLEEIIINSPEGSVSGAPWGATNATVTWTG